MFDDFLDILGGDDFEERPVSIEEFVTSTKYLDLPPLSDLQYKAIRAMSQIYKKSTLINLYGEEEGLKRWNQTCNEVILQLGKGSGKDYMSTIAVTYMVYLLLCLKDPARYYGKPAGDTIDIINIAVNAQQAKNVFFKGLSTRIERSPWFANKYIKKADSIDFDKNISCYSGHSEREAFEGYNVIAVILDEISGFAIDSTSGNEQAKTGEAIYDMYRASVDSRFPDFGKVVLLSFPRYKGDYIQQRYDAVVADKEVVIRAHEFTLDEDLGNAEGNKFSIEWEEDHINSYRVPKVFAMKRPTWEVNPTRAIDDFKVAFFTNPTDALARFACMPSDAIDAFFKSREKIEQAFSEFNPIDDDQRFMDWFKPEPDKEYFIHVDLAQKHDHCAVTMAHIDRWVYIKMFNNYEQKVPIVKVDFVKWWTPKPDQAVNFTDVKDFIVNVRRMGFPLKLVTFDRWNSFEMMTDLKSVGINTENLSVAKKHYEDMAMVVSEERLKGPRVELLISELLRLRIIKDKVDHPRKGSKDLADATCGAIYNALTRSSRREQEEVEVHTFADVKRDNRLEEESRRKQQGIIAPPNTPVPRDIADYLESLRII
jgi:hypothetical protein